MNLGHITGMADDMCFMRDHCAHVIADADHLVLLWHCLGCMGVDHHRSYEDHQMSGTILLSCTGP
jgi:hypothetical protein